MTNTFSREERFFKDLKKADLHLHLGGAYPVEFLEKHLEKEEALLLREQLSLYKKKVNYHEGFRIFETIRNIVNTDDKVYEGVLALCENAYRDGVSHLEARTGLKNLGTSEEGYLCSILQALKASEKKDFTTALLLSVKRKSSPDFVRKTVNLAIKYKEAGVVGIDISDDSTIGDVFLIVPELLRAKEEGLKIALHIGESPKETNQYKLLKILQPDRLGHGVFLEQEAVDWMLENKVPLEVCLTSGHIVEMIEEVKHHPGFFYHKQGHPIILCTDDPLIFSTSLSKEYELALEKGDVTEDELVKLAENSLKYRF